MLFVFLTWWGPVLISTSVYQQKWLVAARVFVAFVLASLMYWSILWGVPRSARAVWCGARKAVTTPLGSRLVAAMNIPAEKFKTSAKRGLRAFGVIVRWTLVVGLAWYLISTMPNIANVPIAKLTLVMLGAAGFRVFGLWVVLNYAFGGEVDYHAWGVVGLMLVMLIVYGALGLWYWHAHSMSINLKPFVLGLEKALGKAR